MPCSRLCAAFSFFVAHIRLLSRLTSLSPFTCAASWAGEGRGPTNAVRTSSETQRHLTLPFTRRLTTQYPELPGLLLNGAITRGVFRGTLPCIQPATRERTRPMFDAS